MADFFAFFVVLFLCFILDLIFFPVISSFQDVSGWKLWKMSRILWQVQKGNSYLYEGFVPRPKTNFLYLSQIYKFSFDQFLMICYSRYIDF